MIGLFVILLTLGAPTKKNIPVKIYKRLSKDLTIPDSVRIYIDSVDYYWGKDDVKKAKYFFDKLLKYNPPQYSFYVNYGYILWDLGKTKDAIKVFEKVLKKFPYDEATLAALFYLYDEIGDIKKRKEVARRLIYITDNQALKKEAQKFLQTSRVSLFNYSFYLGTYYTTREEFVDSDLRINLFFPGILGIKPLIGFRVLTDSRSGKLDIYEDNHWFTYVGAQTGFWNLISIFVYYGYFRRFKIQKTVMEGDNFAVVGFLYKEWMYRIGKTSGLFYSLYGEVNHEKRTDYNTTLTIEMNTGFKKKLGRITMSSSVYYKFIRDRKKFFYNNLMEIGPEMEIVYSYWFAIYARLLKGFYSGIESGEPNPYNTDTYSDLRIGFYIAR